MLLLHDADDYSAPGSWRRTVAALPRVLETLAERGLTPVALARAGAGHGRRRLTSPRLSTAVPIDAAAPAARAAGPRGGRRRVRPCRAAAPRAHALVGRAAGDRLAAAGCTTRSPTSRRCACTRRSAHGRGMLHLEQSLRHRPRARARPLARRASHARLASPTTTTTRTSSSRSGCSAGCGGGGRPLPAAAHRIHTKPACTASAVRCAVERSLVQIEAVSPYSTALTVSNILFSSRHLNMPSTGPKISSRAMRIVHRHVGEHGRLDIEALGERRIGRRPAASDAVRAPSLLADSM